jgi:hypothetical protein
LQQTLDCPALVHDEHYQRAAMDGASVLWPLDVTDCTPRGAETRPGPAGHAAVPKRPVGADHAARGEGKLTELCGELTGRAGQGIGSNSAPITDVIGKPFGYPELRAGWTR